MAEGKKSRKKTQNALAVVKGYVAGDDQSIVKFFIILLCLWGALFAFLIVGIFLQGGEKEIFTGFSMPKDTSELGGSLGILDGLFSTIAIFLGLIAVILQGKELKEQTKAITEQLDEQKTKNRLTVYSAQLNFNAFMLNYRMKDLNNWTESHRDNERRKAEDKEHAAIDVKFSDLEMLKKIVPIADEKSWAEDEKNKQIIESFKGKYNLLREKGVKSGISISDDDQKESYFSLKSDECRLLMSRSRFEINRIVRQADQINGKIEELFAEPGDEVGRLS